MATFTVTYDAGTAGRLTNADATTGFTADGATPTAEPDFVYQGSGSVSILVKLSEVGMYYTSSSTDMTTPKVVLFKVIQTNYGAIDGNGLQVRVGSGTGAYAYYYLYTASTYPTSGGWQLVAIDPNETGWRTGTTGSPSLSAATYWAIRSDCSATAKTQNVALDAIDVFAVGTGLTGVGGDGASADGTFADFLSFDEGTSTNRYGIVSSKSGIYYVNGVLTIGSATETDFADSNRVLVFPQQYVSTGFCGIDWNLSNTNSVMSATNCVFNARGSNYGGTRDTRPDHDVYGTNGSLSLDGSTFNVFRKATLNTKVSAEGCTFINGGNIAANGASMIGSVVSGSSVAIDGSALTWNVPTDTDGYLDDMTFTKGGFAHHAIELGVTSPSSVTLRGVTFSGFNASNSQNDSVIYVAKASNSVTINAVSCSGTVSYKSAGATVTVVVDPVTLSVDVVDINTGDPISGARVWVPVASAIGGWPYEDSVSITRSGSTATVSHTAHGLSTNDWVWVQGATEDEYNITAQITKINDDSYSYTVTGTPTTPAGGSPTATFVVISTTTDAFGNASASYSYADNQPISGRVRTASGAGPYYKTAPITGSIDSTKGLTVTVQMIPDE
jgi:hypothetical protein